MSNAPFRILAVDDEPSTLRMIGRILDLAGFISIPSASGEDALENLPEHAPDLVLLDVMLPGMSGWEVCRRIWDVRPGTPVIMLTAKEAEEDVLAGFYYGVEDYITKPFRASELVARLRAVLRRTKDTAGDFDCHIVTYGDLVVDVFHRSANIKGVEIDLSEDEFNVLCSLTKHGGRLVTIGSLLTKINDVSRVPNAGIGQILEYVWGSDHRGRVRYLREMIRDLRRKLGDYGDNPQYVVDESEAGFRLRSVGIPESNDPRPKTHGRVFDQQSGATALGEDPTSSHPARSVRIQIGVR